MIINYEAGAGAESILITQLPHLKVKLGLFNMTVTVAPILCSLLVINTVAVVIRSRMVLMSGIR